MTGTEGGTRPVHAPSDPTQPLEPDASLGELLARVTSDFGDLVSTQVELAKVEIKEEVSKAGKGAALLSGGAVAALMTVVTLSFAAAWGLAEVVEPGWAFLIVGVIWAIAAAVLLASGRQRITAVQPVPETRATIKEDVQWAQQQKI